MATMTNPMILLIFTPLMGLSLLSSVKIPYSPGGRPFALGIFFWRLKGKDL